MASSESTDTPQTQEVTVSEELSVHAAIAGITLSHNAIPLFGMSNPLDGVMTLLSVGSILAIVSVYVDDRYNTAGAGLSATRTLSTILCLYLLSNGMRGFFELSDLDPSGSIQSILTAVFILVVAVSIQLRRISIGEFSDYRVAKRQEKNSSWSKSDRLKSNFLKSLVGSLLLFPIVLTDPVRYFIPFISGYSAVGSTGLIFASFFFREDSLKNINSGKAKVAATYPSAIIIFLVLFGGLEFGW